jgi:hypothetical protein
MIEQSERPQDSFWGRWFGCGFGHDWRVHDEPLEEMCCERCGEIRWFPEFDYGLGG